MGTSSLQEPVGRGDTAAPEHRSCAEPCLSSSHMLGKPAEQPIRMLPEVVIDVEAVVAALDR